MPAKEHRVRKTALTLAVLNVSEMHHAAIAKLKKLKVLVE
jgi:hypothetical protein